jgi:hypothetical protein
VPGRVEGHFEKEAGRGTRETRSITTVIASKSGQPSEDEKGRGGGGGAKGLQQGVPDFPQGALVLVGHVKIGSLALQLGRPDSSLGTVGFATWYALKGSSR